MVEDCGVCTTIINECRDSGYVLTEKESEVIDEYEMIQNQWMLTRIKGEEVESEMDPDELVNWVVDLRKNGTTFSSAAPEMVVRSMMRME